MNNTLSNVMWWFFPVSIRCAYMYVCVLLLLNKMFIHSVHPSVSQSVSVSSFHSFIIMLKCVCILHLGAWNPELVIKVILLVLLIFVYICFQCGQITPQLALKVLLQFDKAINNALSTRVKNRISFKVGRCHTRHHFMFLRV